MWAVLTGPADWVCHIGTLTPCIEAVAWSCIIVTWWSGAGGIQALSERPTAFLQCFDTVDLVIWPVKIVPDMTYNVFGGMLNLAQSILKCLYRTLTKICCWKVGCLLTMTHCICVYLCVSICMYVYVSARVSQAASWCPATVTSTECSRETWRSTSQWHWPISCECRLTHTHITPLYVC